MSSDPVEVSESDITKITALLRKADSTDSPHEAAAFRKKATQMSVKRKLIAKSYEDEQG